MNKADLQELRDHLVARKKDLLAQGDLRVDPNRTDPNVQADEDEQPLNEMNQVIASRRNKVRTRELQGINRAIQRIDNNPEDFGFCQDCEEPIPMGRLKLMPWAPFCVPCQEDHSDSPRGYRRRHARDFVD